MLTQWGELSATWNTRNGVNLWAAGAFSEADYDPTPLGPIFTDSTGDKLVETPELLSVVQDWVRGRAENFGLALIGVTEVPEDLDVEYGTKENQVASNQARLRLSWVQLASTQPATVSELIANPLLVTGTTPVTVTMKVSAEGALDGVTPPDKLVWSGEGGATATLRERTRAGLAGGSWRAHPAALISRRSPTCTTYRPAASRAA